MAPRTAQNDLAQDSNRASGLWLTDGLQVLLVRRANWTTHPEMWTVPGGRLKVGEEPLEGARREFKEEVGYLPPHTVTGHRDVPGFRCYRATVDSGDIGWNPLLDEEHTDFVWADDAWVQENWGELHPGLQTMLGSMRTAARDTIDKSWINKVRKTWKAYVQKAKSVGYMEAEKYFEQGFTWLRALVEDMAFSKGFFTFLRDKGKTEIYKWRTKAMEDLKTAANYIRAGRDVFRFWDKTMTPGTKEYEMGAQHRKSLESDPAGPEKALAKTIRNSTMEAVAKADKAFSRKFLALLTKIVNKFGDIEWGSFEREFNVGNVKVVMVDLPTALPQEQGDKRLPSSIIDYIRQLAKAEALLKQKGLGFLWYGNFFVSCKTCGGDNSQGKHFGVGARYNIRKDEVTIYSDPHSNLYRLIAHELGHRYYYKFMSQGDRARFDSWFGDVPAVSEYGGTVSEEDFAEVFSYYVDNRNLTRDQLERFKQFIKTKGRRANSRTGLSVDGLISNWIFRPVHPCQR